MKFFRDSKGDTIVEVLIAMAVVAVVLGGAYSSANKSFANTRAAQERGEALKVAESQLESLNTLYKNRTVNIYDSINNVFCLDNTPARVTIVGYDPAAVPLLTTDFGRYPAECLKQGRYHVSITYTQTSPTADDNFNVVVKWERFNGGRDQLNAVYRLHQ